MDPKLRLTSIIISVVLILLIIWFVKRRSLSEQLAIIWICLGTVVFLVSLFFEILSPLSSFLGIMDPNNLALFCGIIILLCFCLIMSSKISDVTEKIKILAQENALLRYQVSEMKDTECNEKSREFKKP